MKAKPFTLAAFLFASLFVAGESVVVLDRVGRAASARWSRAHAPVATSNVTRFAASVVQAILGEAKF